jgi:hypothetical protein
MASILPHWLWPSLSEVKKLPLPASGPLTANIVIGEFAAGLFARQSADYDALDTKAATLIGAVLVFAGLIFPNLSPANQGEWIVTALLLGVLGYTLVMALAAYRVSLLHGPWTPEVAVGTVNYSATAARVALAVATLRAYLGNYPILQRKAQFVRLSLYSLIPAALLAATLFVVGAFK